MNKTMNILFSFLWVSACLTAAESAKSIEEGNKKADALFNEVYPKDSQDNTDIYAIPFDDSEIEEEEEERELEDLQRKEQKK